MIFYMVNFVLSISDRIAAKFALIEVATLAVHKCEDVWA